MRLARIVGTFLFTALLASATAWSQESCKALEGKLDTVAESPGNYIGNAYGDLAGAVSLRTVSRAKDDGSSAVSIVTLTYVDRRGFSSFDALLTAIDEPTGTGQVVREAWGELTNGTGRFASMRGEIKLRGPITERRFESELYLTACR